MIQLGEKIKYYREISGLNQPEFANAIGTSQANICRWEKNQTTPNIDFCIRIAQYFNITLDELIDYPDTTKPTAEHTPIIRATSETAAFVSDFSDIIREKNFVNIAKLYKAAPKELRAVALGMLIGLMNSNGINTQGIIY